MASLHELLRSLLALCLPSLLLLVCVRYYTKVFKLLTLTVYVLPPTLSRASKTKTLTSSSANNLAADNPKRKKKRETDSRNTLTSKHETSKI